VVEDRGPLGVGRRRLYRVRLDQDPDEPVFFEMPEEHLEPAPSLDKRRIIRYLKEGALVTILRANLSGGRNQPQVWLTSTAQGEPTYTFIAERGLVGGETIPFFALNGDKLFTPKEGEVIRFLTSFGLSRTEAKDVIRTVGTSP
jgi:hypothetical protein